MAKAKNKNVRTKVVTTEEVEEGGGNDEILPEAGIDSAEVDAITTLLALDDSDGIKYRVHRMPSKPGERMALCQDYTRDELAFETIRATFGGGTYRITALDAHHRYVSSKNVTIAELPKAPGAASAPNTDLAAILQAAKGDNSGGNELLLAMIKSQGDMMTALLTRPPQPPPPAGPSVMEIISMIQAMKDDKPAADSGDSAVKLLLQGLELGQKLGGGGETGFMDVASRGIEMLSPLLAKANEQPAAVPMNPNPQPRIAPPAATPQAPQQVDPMFQKLEWLKRQTQNLVVQARRGKDPGLYAEVMLDNLPDFITAEEIFERLSAPDAIAQLSQLNPDIAPHAEWFERFRKAVIEFLSPEEGAGDDAPAGDLES